MAKTYILRASIMAFALVIFNLSSSAVTLPSTEPVPPKSESTVAAPLAGMSVDDFLSLTPKKYKELTGEKLSITQKISLKLAQKKNQEGFKKQRKNRF